MSIQTIEQKRAEYALDEVQQFVSNNDKKSKEQWKTRANEMPAMIQMNGLGQTAAFYLSKGEKDKHKQLYDVLSDWLCKEIKVLPSDKDLINGITQCDMPTYRIAQAEAQALLIWVKKFSKAFCTEKENKDTSEDSYA